MDITIIRDRFRATWKTFGVILIIAAVIAVVVFMLCRQYGLLVEDFTRDPIFPPYLGFVSQLGILVWAGAAATCALGAAVLKVQNEKPRQGAANSGLHYRFLVCSTLLTLMIGVDDAFMLHDHVLPHIGIHELLVYGVYASAALVYLAVFAKAILRTEFPLLFVAFGGFGLSVIADYLFSVEGAPFWFEDGVKGIGILCWFAYYFRTTTALLSGKLMLDGELLPASTRLMNG